MQKNKNGSFLTINFYHKYVEATEARQVAAPLLMETADAIEATPMSTTVRRIIVWFSIVWLQEFLVDVCRLELSEVCGQVCRVNWPSNLRVRTSTKYFYSRALKERVERKEDFVLRNEARRIICAVRKLKPLDFRNQEVAAGKPLLYSHC